MFVKGIKNCTSCQGDNVFAISDYHTLLSWDFAESKYALLCGNRQKVAFLTMLKVWRRAEWRWGNLTKIHQILFYYRVLELRRRETVSRECASIREAIEALFCGFIKGIFAFWHDNFLKRLISQNANLIYKQIFLNFSAKAIKLPHRPFISKLVEIICISTKNAIIYCASNFAMKRIRLLFFKEIDSVLLNESVCWLINY